jgi:hypothetical protein
VKNRLAAIFGDSRVGWRRAESLEDGAQKPAEPAQQQREVATGGGEHGIGAVAVAALEVIADRL